MDSYDILFSKGTTILPDKIKDAIAEFPNRYKRAMGQTIMESRVLDSDGVAFVRCAAVILISFLMTRGGHFRGLETDRNGNVKGSSGEELLRKCWERIRVDLLEIKRSIPESGSPRDRYLLELSNSKQADLIEKVWTMTKQLQDFTRGETTHGLVGASKILFAVLPEIVLPVDSKQWLKLFRTFDIRDVINRMVSEVQEWEAKTHVYLNEVDPEKKLTTIPSIYNVMAMKARTNQRPL